MKHTKIPKIAGIFLLASILMVSCQSKFLDEKPNSSLVVPTTLEDFQHLLNNFLEMNATPILGEVSADDYYLDGEGALNAQPVQFRNAYLWKPDIYEGQVGIPDWNALHKQVFVANVVLEGIGRLEKENENKQEWNQTRGWALFARAHALFNLAQLFAPVYDEATADVDLGVPIRLKAGVDEPTTRASVRETYHRIITDLTEATGLLPAPLPIPDRNRPSEPAALGLLARVYLNMRNYAEALNYANECLALYDELIDYNDVLTISPPFPLDNAEVLYQNAMGPTASIFQSYSTYTRIDSNLLASYTDDDLRKRLYFRLTSGEYEIYRSYLGKTGRFGGIATDEILLIKAECLARKGEVNLAMETLNQLWKNRSDESQPFAEIEASSSIDALTAVLAERRKELIFRGLRWQDLRRLNKEGYNITLRRNIGGKAYSLAPNSPLYVLPIPPDEIQLSGISQNIR